MNIRLVVRKWLSLQRYGNLKTEAMASKLFQWPPLLARSRSWSSYLNCWHRRGMLDMSFTTLKWFVITIHDSDYVVVSVLIVLLVMIVFSQDGTRLLTWKSVLLGAHSVGVLDRAAEVEHGKHGDDHHHTLEQQGDLKLLPYPAGTRPKHQSHLFTFI